MAELWDTLGQLVVNLGTLLVLLLALALRWSLVIAWLAWWLFAVDWKKVWPVLARGAWAPVLLLLLIVALVWAQLEPAEGTFLGVVSVPNFWWQLGGVSVLTAVALLCGWLQGVFGITPPEISVEPVIPHGMGHEHPVGTLHGHEFAHSDDPHHH
jgi:hypothetical protein